MDIEFRNKLLTILTDAARREDIGKIEEEDTFIYNLAWQFRVEIANYIEYIEKLHQKPDVEDKGKEAIFQNLSLKYHELSSKFQELSLKASFTEQNSLAYARYLFLADLLSNSYFLVWATNWLKEVADKYPTVILLRYLFALSLYNFRLYGIQEVEPTIDPQTVMFNAIRENSKEIINLWKAYTDIRKQYFKNPVITSLAYELYYKDIYPGVPRETFHNALTSIDLVTITDYYLIVGDKKKAEEIAG
ncbi:MAG: hypothetical protein AB1478_07375 [Nitrospirota bacterium]